MILSPLYEIDRNAERRALNEAMPYRLEDHFKHVGRVEERAKGKYIESKLVCKWQMVPMEAGTRVAVISRGFILDNDAALIEHLGHVVRSLKTRSLVRIRTSWKATREGGMYSTAPFVATETHVDKEEWVENCNIAILHGRTGVDSDRLKRDFGEYEKPTGKRAADSTPKEPKRKRART